MTCVLRLEYSEMPADLAAKSESSPQSRAVQIALAPDQAEDLAQVLLRLAELARQGSEQAKS
ncbi:hypothetical protein AT574_06420 [Phaeobacter inhibens]|nr:hypothetical protein AT574_06420 [Phaeobacter inhibens]